MQIPFCTLCIKETTGVCLTGKSLCGPQPSTAHSCLNGQCGKVTVTPTSFPRSFMPLKQQQPFFSPVTKPSFPVLGKKIFCKTLHGENFLFQTNNKDLQGHHGTQSQTNNTLSSLGHMITDQSWPMGIGM